MAKALQVRSRNPAGCGKIAHCDQQSRQMLFTLRSIVLFSSSIAASPFVCGPMTSVPRADERAELVVTPACEFAAEPDELAVPAQLVPGGGGDASFEELPAPLGSLTELFGPPTLAGPEARR